MSSAVRQRQFQAAAAASQGRSTAYLCWWLMLAIFFEYARPGSFVSGINVLRLNTLIPIGLVLACTLSKDLRPMKEVWLDSQSRWLAAYFFVIAFGLVHADVTLYAFNVTKTVLGYLLLAFVIVRICTTLERIRSVYAVLVIAHLFLIVMNPAAILNPEQRNYIIGGTFLGDGNDFSLSICIAAPMAIELALASKSRIVQLVWWGALLVLCLAVVASQSRGGTLGLAAVAGYLWLRSPRKALTMILALVGVAAILAYAPDQYFDRMRTIGNYQADGSAMGRITAWKAAIQMCIDHPLWGVGAGMFPVSFGTIYRPAEHMPWLTAHSMYFLLLGELGIPGVVVLLGLIFGNLKANRRLMRARDATVDPKQRGLFPQGPNRMLYLLSASMVGFAVCGAFLSVAYYPHLFVLTALMVSARAVASRDPSLQGAAAARPGGAVRARR